MGDLMYLDIQQLLDIRVFHFLRFYDDAASMGEEQVLTMSPYQRHDHILIPGFARA